MRFTNTLDLYGEECLDAEADFIYTSSPVIMYQYIPYDRVQELGLKAQYDCIVTGIEALDYINIDNLKWYVNGAQVQMENGIKICAGDSLGISYTLSYKDGVSKTNIMKTTQAIKYINSEGEECIFSHPHGFIIVDFSNDNFVKRYIDDNLGGK